MVIRIILLAIIFIIVGCASTQETAKNKKDAKQQITISGGSGESYDSAIVINNVLKQSEGVAAEYQYISKLHGEKNKTWRISGQYMFRQEKKVYDVVEIVTIPASEKRIYYFDVSSFPWKKR